ncbi:MAG: hypothetical protein IT211_03620 [Armatimonadetes bacterium]|nr:hypothetical protein [Armatimonadota bacterium]
MIPHRTTAIANAETELQDAVAAMQIGNTGRARVSARRAVGAFLQGVAGLLEADPGSHAMANLRWVESHPGLPDEIRAAAARLLAGPRTLAEGGVASQDPVNDARTVIDGLQQTLRLA